MRPARRRRRVVILAIFVMTAALLLIVYVLALRAVRVRVLDVVQHLSEVLARPVTLSSLEVGPSGLSLRDLRLSGGEHDILRFSAVDASVNLRAVLRGRRLPEELRVRGVRGRMVLPPAPGGFVARFLQRGSSGPAPEGDEAPEPRRWQDPLPVVSCEDLRLTLVAPSGAVVADIAVERAELRPGTDEEGAEALMLSAMGRFREGLGRLAGATWSLEGTLPTRAGGHWRLRLAFTRPVSFPTVALPTRSLHRAGYRAVAVQALEIDSAGKVRALGVHLEPGAKEAPGGAPAISVREIEAEIPEGFATSPADVGGLVANFGKSAILLRGLETALPGHGVSLDVAELSLGFAAEPGPEGGLPALARFEVLRPSLSVHNERLSPMPALLQDPGLALGGEASGDEEVGPPGAAAADGLPAVLAPMLRLLGDAELSVIDGRLTLRATPELPTVHLDAIELFVEPRGEGGRESTFSCRWRPEGSEPVHAAVEARLDRNGRPHVHLLCLEGAWLAAFRERLPGFVRLPPDAGGVLTIVPAASPRERGLLPEGSVEQPGDRALSGRIELVGLGFEHRKIARIPVTDIAIEADYRVLWRPSRDEIFLRLDDLSGGNAKADVALRVSRLRGQPEGELAIRFPEQPCDDLLRDIPQGLIPRLEGARLAGNLQFTLDARVDLADPDAFRFRLDGDWSSCRAETLGDQVDVARLEGDFSQRIWEKGEPTDIRVGPGTSSYVPLDVLPDYVWQAAIATEDMAFFKHEGFRTTLMSRAIRLNLKRGRYVYGGSTISQQLVKNLFLSREKTLSRKLEEAFITWHMERTLSKNRILELYLNCIEYGPGIYGIRKAAYTYFGVHPSALSPLEAAFIMGLKPDPKSGYNVYRRRLVRSWWREKLQHILRRLWRDMDVLSETQYRMAAPYVPIFHYPGEGRVRPEATGLDEGALGPPPDMPPMPPRSEGRHR